MNDQVKGLVTKAIDDLEAAKILIPHLKQHDNAGSHLCKSTEKFLKAFLELRKISMYPKNGKDGHDLGILFRMLVSTDFPVDTFQELLALQIYDSRAGYGYVDEDLRIDLRQKAALIEKLKKFVLGEISKS